MMRAGLAEMMARALWPFQPAWRHGGGVWRDHRTGRRIRGTKLSARVPRRQRAVDAKAQASVEGGRAFGG